jgi:hypothetical protein
MHRYDNDAKAGVMLEKAVTAVLTHEVPADSLNLPNDRLDGQCAPTCICSVMIGTPSRLPSM